VVPLRGPNGDWLRLKLDLPGHSIWLRAWQVQVGRVRLYLLDSNDVANYPAYRGITNELYGGGSYLRLMQELALGIGGWRLLAGTGHGWTYAAEVRADRPASDFTARIVPNHPGAVVPLEAAHIVWQH